MTGSGTRRFGTVAILGAPNAGKSTLLNRLTGTAISIVTHKAQTTRTRIRGIITLGDAQIAAVDTPGLFAPRTSLDRAMLAAAWEALRGIEAALLLVDAAGYPRSVPRGFVGELNRRLPETVQRALALNKIDLIRRDRLLAMASELNDATRFDRTFMISAQTGDGVEGLARWLAEIAPEGEWQHPPQRVTDMPEPLLAAEVTRKQLLLRLHDELPYNLTVESVSWREGEKGAIHADQEIVVARPSHRRMVIGADGATIAAVGRAARLEIGQLLGRKTHLTLHVRVRRRWQDDPKRYPPMGLARPPSKGPASR